MEGESKGSNKQIKKLQSNDCELKLNVRPTPDSPVVPPGTPPVVKEYIENVRRRARDVERGFREVEAAVNALIVKSG